MYPFVDSVESPCSGPVYESLNVCKKDIYVELLCGSLNVCKKDVCVEVVCGSLNVCKNDVYVELVCEKV